MFLLATELQTVTAEELVEEVKTGVIQQQIEKLIPELWSFLWCVVLSIIVFIIGTRVIKGIIKLFHKALERREIDSGVETFLESVIKWILYIILITIIMGLFGVTTASISAAVAGLGVTAGLALQGALSNFAGGVLILVMHPFRVGDYIIEKNSNQEGTVEKINIIYTTLRMIDGRFVQIPNGTLSATSLINCTAMTHRMFNETVGISYSSDIKKAKEIMKAVAEKQDHLITSEEIKVFVSELGDSSVDIGLRFWVETEYYWQTKWDTLEEIKERFDKAGIEICYNQLDVHIRE